MYLIAIPVTAEFNATKALTDAFEYGILTEPAKAWRIVGTAYYSTDARLMAQAIANDRLVTVEIRSAFLNSGSHYGYAEIKPETKPIVDAAVEELTPEKYPEKYDGVPADTGAQ